MTKVQIRFELTKPLDDYLLRKIADAHGLYGMALVRPSPDMKFLLVDYDASRLSADEVESALRRFGLPVKFPDSPPGP